MVSNFTSSFKKKRKENERAQNLKTNFVSVGLPIDWTVVLWSQCENSKTVRCAKNKRGPNNRIKWMKKKQWKQRRRQQQSEIPADANQIARPASTRSPMEWDSEGQRKKIIFWKKKAKSEIPLVSSEMWLFPRRQDGVLVSLPLSWSQEVHFLESGPASSCHHQTPKCKWTDVCVQSNESFKHNTRVSLCREVEGWWI